MANNYFKAHIWLLETLQSRGRLTLKELKNLWLHSAVNEERKTLAARTFSHHREAILDIFGIEIACDRRDNTYYINNEDEVFGGQLRSWMLQALSISNLLNESAGLKNRIIFEKVPSGQKYLTTVIQAIRDNRVLNVKYHSYRKSELEELVLEPYFLRQFKRRWYLYAHKGDDKSPHIFALDRILSMEIGQASFSMPEDFIADEYFSGIYGKSIYPEMWPETVILKTTNKQAKYFNSLPLHESQEIVEENEEYTVFKYFLTPDYDFIQDVLSFGASVEVLEPERVRKEIGKTVSDLNRKYNLQ